MKIGFVGLGAMGKPMACNLLNAGYEVYAFDVVEAAVKEMESKGARGCATAGELAGKADVIICSLPNAKIVENVMCSEGGVFENCKAGTIIIDMSSVAPTVRKRWRKRLPRRGSDISMLRFPAACPERPQARLPLWWEPTARPLKK